MSKCFGYSLAVDAYACDVDLDSIDVFYAILDDLVKYLGMTKQAPPDVFRSPPEFAGKNGLTGWVPLIESGISVHTLTDRRFCSFDVYSCREFDPDATAVWIARRVRSEVYEQQFLYRGLKYHE